MADGDLFIHVQVEVDDASPETTVTINSGSAGTVGTHSTAGTIDKPTAGRPE